MSRCQYLKDNVGESEATALYLKLCQYVTSAFIDPKLSPLDRIYRSQPCESTEETAAALCESIEQMNLTNGDEEFSAETATSGYRLRDYTDQNIVIDELCPFHDHDDTQENSIVTEKVAMSLAAIQ